jgi:hypothetical protein
MTKHRFWYTYLYAAEEVERRLGCSWGAAQKALLDACERGDLKWQGYANEPSVADNDFHRWLDAKLNRPVGGKQARLGAALGQLFPNEAVPDPQEYPRKRLQGDLTKLDPSLHPLDLKTLKRGIETHNRAIGNARIPSVSD